MTGEDSTVAHPEFTIVTPSLNQGPFIEQTIRSVLDQRDVSVQYIVVDGSSSDETVDVLARYEDRVATIIREPDEGQADALVKGFALAKGEFVGYLNSDDYLLPGALAHARDLLRADGTLDLVYGDRIYVDGSGRLLRYWRLPAHSNYMMLRWDFIPQEAAFWRRGSMEQVGGIDGSYRFAMDYDLFARMMKARQRMKHVPRFFAVFREHAASKTSAQLSEVGIPEMERVREKYAVVVRPWDHLLGAIFLLLLRLRSLLHLKLASAPVSPEGK